jgi:hypothetical protein
MHEFETICPYPGLRPFTEEESLYFKGREEQIINLTGLLEEKKFLMVTGASGDGKSSLIYGGLIPQARAGFFKASYTNWFIAGFRPERSPMQNMVMAIASQLGLDPGATAIELSRGFSSLVELYKSSSLFIDKESRAWLEATEEERNQLERKAGNLLIIIDQFEEFFTNPENFTQGIPSQDSRLLLNIILETSKISLRENLPIYVVCTMRSDYIGQCAAFRGLPEFIGFSQFFVPRMQRKELQQAIEMPATLSGNRISKRLTDRLIADIEEGLDQLPILQHALKQIWKAADSGLEEMDLIHYAMVGGLDGEKLPKENLAQFRSWRDTLPDYEKEYLNKTGLSKVLDIHANKLYEVAADRYNQSAERQITNKQAKLIIGLSFSCLTRIDENRAVRNRMTLEEITNIINVPEFTMDMVAGVLKIFREPENTLIRPFLETADDLHSEPLSPETVLDITHEALIRNWQLLKKWSDREFEYFTVFLDFKQQLIRWLDSGKSNDYLLPVGPLAYFEKWYKECRPNKYWINRYNNTDIPDSEKLKDSETTLQNLQKFLRKSALNLLITRTFMKYGAAKIAKAVSAVMILGLCIFLLYSWHIRRNDVVLGKLIREGTSLLNDKETAAEYKAYFVMFASRLDTANIKDISRVVTDNQTKIDISLKIFERLFFVNKESNPPIRGQALSFADSVVNQSIPLSTTEDIFTVNKYLNNLNDLVRNESYYLQTRNDEKILREYNNNLKLLGNIIIKIFTAPAIDTSIDIKALNIGIENALNFRCLSADQIHELTSSISPFSNDLPVRQKFERTFPSKAKLNVGFAQTVSHGGGYEKLACLYAAQGDVQHALRCLDSLNKYNDYYDQNWNNSTNIGGYFLMYGHTGSFRDFIRSYSKSIGIPCHAYLKTLVNLAGIKELRRTAKFIQHGNYNENLALFNFDLVKELFSIYQSTLEEDIKDKNELNFNLALLYKQEGVVFDKLSGESDIAWNRKACDTLFSIATDYYSRLPADFLKSKVEIYQAPCLGEKEKILMRRSNIFLYPDHFRSGESFSFEGGFRYYGESFFNYLLRHDLFRKYYHDQEDYTLLITWVDSYFEMYDILTGTGFWNRTALNYPLLSQTTLLSLDSILVLSEYSDALDNAWINLKLAKDYFESGDTSRAFEMVNRLKFLAFRKAHVTEDAPFHNMQLNIAAHLAIYGKREEAMGIVERFSNTKNKLIGYSKLATFTSMRGLDSESNIYRDSAINELKRVKFFRDNYGNFGFDYRTGLVELLTLQDDGLSRKQARELISAMEFDSKLNGVLAMIRTLARMDKYFEARASVPGLANPQDRLRCINAILYNEVLKRSEGSNTPWSGFDRNLFEWINYTEVIYDLFEY